MTAILAFVFAAAVAADYPDPETSKQKIKVKDLDFTATAFMHAVAFERHDDIRWYIEAGMDVNKVTDNYGNYAIHDAANGTREDTVKLLLSLGANPGLKNRNQYTALHYAAHNHTPGLIQNLLDKGADINARTDRGRTGLHFAAERGRQDIVEFLIRAGATVDAKDNDGNTPLMIAIKKGRYEILSTLIKAGANINFSSEERDVKNLTPLIQALRLHDSDLASHLIHAGADVNATSDTGFTPLMIAQIENDAINMAQLLNHGAKVDDKGGRKKTPLQMCLESKRYSLCDLLIKAGAEFNPASKEMYKSLYNATNLQQIDMLQ